MASAAAYVAGRLLFPGPNHDRATHTNDAATERTLLLMIAKSVVLEEGVVIHHPDLVNLYGCTVGPDRGSAPSSRFSAAPTIGRNCKISSHTFICEGVTIEDGVFVGHGVMFINDLPRAPSTPTAACRRTPIGAGATS